MSVITDNCVLSSRVRLARNIRNLPFPSRMTEKQALFDVIMPVEKILKGMEMQVYLLKEINELNRYMLMEKHLISKDLVKNHDLAAVCLNDDQSISIMLNEEDHFRLQCILGGFNLDGAFKKINQVDAVLMEKLDIAYDEKLGFLTSCPTNLGTAMRASVMMFLPGLTLTSRLNKVIDTVQRLGVVVRGAYGESSQAMGFLYQISNQSSFGYTENQIIAHINKTVEKICNLEKQARVDLLNRDPEGLREEILDAKAEILNCNEISHEKFLKLYALIKLGIDFDFLKINDKIGFDNLLDECASSQIQVMNGRRLNEHEVQFERAKLLKDAFLRLLDKER